MYWFIKVFKQYGDFKGRARRKEYWMFVLFNVIFSFVIQVVGLLLFSRGVGTTFVYLWSLAMIIPNLAVTVRRLHDIGKSGWMFLIILIPIIGPIWLFVLMVTDSQPGENEYGANPKEEEVSAV